MNDSPSLQMKLNPENVRVSRLADSLNFQQKPVLAGIGKSFIAKPEAYDGSKEKYFQWWRTVKLYLAGFEAEPTDQQKIIIVLSYMEGNNAAGRFADLYVIQGLLASSTFDEFSAKLRESFRPAQHIAKKKLLKLRQDKETVMDFVVRMKLLIIEADYHVNTHSRLLINILRNGVNNEVVEFVERSQPELLNSHSFAQWESALVRADQVLSEIAARKRSRGTVTGTSSSFVSRGLPPKPLTIAAPGPYRFDSPIRSLVHLPPAPPQPSPPITAVDAIVSPMAGLSFGADIGPNTPGRFGSQGVPMDIGQSILRNQPSSPVPSKTLYSPISDDGYATPRPSFPNFSTQSASPPPFIQKSAFIPVDEFSYHAVKALLEQGIPVTDDNGTDYTLGAYGDIYWYDEYGHEYIFSPPPSPDTSRVPSPEPVPSRSKRAEKRARQRAESRRIADAIRAHPMT